jgi:hypothetical protein
MVTNTDAKQKIYALQNDTIQLLYDSQTNTSKKIDEINTELSSTIPTACRQSLFLFPFANSINLSEPIKVITDIFLNQIVQLETSDKTDVSIDMNDVLAYIDSLDKFDAFKVAEYIQTEYLNNETHMFNIIKSKCRKLIPSSSSIIPNSKRRPVVNLQMPKNQNNYAEYLKYLGQFIEVVFNSTSPFEATGFSLSPGSSCSTDIVKLFYFKKGNIRLIFNSEENKDIFLDALCN